MPSVKTSWYTCYRSYYSAGAIVLRVQAIDTVDELAVKAVMKTFTCFQPPPESTSQLLLRELSLDGGRLPSNLLDKPQPMALRFKYALDGCQCAPTSTEACDPSAPVSPTIPVLPQRHCSHPLHSDCLAKQILFLDGAM